MDRDQDELSGARGAFWGGVLGTLLWVGLIYLYRTLGG